MSCKHDKNLCRPCERDGSHKITRRNPRPVTAAQLDYLQVLADRKKQPVPFVKTRREASNTIEALTK